MRFKIKTDTNGNHPDRLMEIVEAGLVDYVAMDIKNSPAKYARTVGLPSLDLGPVRESAGLLMENRVPYEFRTTVIAELHEEDDIRAIGEWIRGAKRYFLQPFTDRDTVPFAGFHAPDAARLASWLEIVSSCVEEARIRGAD
jgi:pyruvate formate lyase activating enzyme